MRDYSEYKTLEMTRDGNILTVKLNRPESLNAVSRTMHDEIVRIFQEIDSDPCSVVILTGAGRAFCAGGDVKSWEDTPVTDWPLKARTAAQHLVESILDVEKPIIAMVNGHAVGLGAVLALLCDVTITVPEAKIGDTHVNVGLVAGDGGPVIIPLLVGINRAKEMIMTGELITGEEAGRIGLVNHVVQLSELESFTRSVAEKFLNRAPFALAATKATLNRIIRRQAFDVLDVSHAWEQVSARTNDHTEAVAAFTRKREPKFTGR